MALGLYLAPQPSPVEGYRLALAYCECYHPDQGASLKHPSRNKIHELVRWVFTREAMKDYRAAGESPASASSSSDA
jgi:hypothetical protein